MNVYVVKRGITLVDIARRYGITLQAILNANPTLVNPSMLLIGQSIYLPDDARPLPIIYTIRYGDTLYSIAQRFDIGLQLLLSANPGISNPDVITAGTDIIIPSPEPAPGMTLYIVQKGDTLYNISKKLGIELETLLKMNAQLTNPNILYIGQQIFIPFIPTSPPTPGPTTFPYQDVSDSLALAQIDQASKNYLEGYSFTDMVPLSNGWVILGDTRTNKIYVLNAITGEVKKEWQLQSTPNSIDFDFENGIILATQAAAKRIVRININEDEVKYIDTIGVNAVVTAGEKNIAFSYSPEWPDGNISIIDISSNQAIGTAKITTDSIRYMAYDKINNNLFLGVGGLSPSYLYRYAYDETTRRLELKQYSTRVGSNGQDLVVSKDGRHVAFSVGSGNGPGYSTYDIDSTDLNNVFGQWMVDAYPTSAFFSNDSKHIVATNSYDVRLFTVDTHRLLRTVVAKYSIENIKRVYFSRGDKIIYVATGEHYSPMNKLYFFKSGL